LPLSQGSVGMFLPRTSCAFGIEATDSFGGCTVTESRLGFDDK